MLSYIGKRLSAFRCRFFVVCVLIGVLAILSSEGNADAGDVTLTWNANTDATTILSNGTHEITAHIQLWSGESQTLNTSFTVANAVNVPPEAEAGPDQNVSERSAITLDGSNSFDADGEISLKWTQTDGPEVILAYPFTDRPWLKAPDTSSEISFANSANGPSTGGGCFIATTGDNSMYSQSPTQIHPALVATVKPLIAIRDVLVGMFGATGTSLGLCLAGLILACLLKADGEMRLSETRRVKSGAT